MADQNAAPQSVPTFSLEGEPPVFLTQDSNAQTGAPANGGANATNPEGGAAAGTTDTTALQVLDGGKFKFGEQEYDGTKLAELVQAGIKVDEINRGATEKFQEAARIRDQNAQELQELNYLREIGQSLAGMPQAAQDAIFQFAGEVDRRIKAGQSLEGISLGGQQGNTQSQANPYAGAQVDLTKLPKFNELSEEGQAIVAAMNGQLAAVQQENAQLRAQLGEVAKVLPEVSAFVRGSKAETEANSAISQIKAEYGVEVTQADIKAAMDATKIANPHAAYVFANRASLQAAAMAAAANGQVQKPPTPPESTPQMFDPKGMTADEIFANVRAGKKMIQ